MKGALVDIILIGVNLVMICFVAATTTTSILDIIQNANAPLENYFLSFCSCASLIVCGWLDAKLVRSQVQSNIWSARCSVRIARI